MIKSASFRNFKSLRHVDVELERLTVFVGPNASGKTSILEGLYYLVQLASKRPEHLFVEKGNLNLLCSRGVITDDIELECRDADAAMRLKATPHPARPDDRSNLELPPIAFERKWTHQVEGKLLSRPGDDWKPLEQNELWSDPIASRFRSAALLRLDASALAEPSYSDQTKPRGEYSGRGLASVLAFMALNQPDRFESVQERLKSVIPIVRRIRFDRVPVSKTETEVVTIDDARLQRNVTREYIGDQLIFDFQGASNVPAHLASEGTILTLGLIATLLGPERPRLILVDDLERGLHPKAQREVVRLLRMILDENQDLQIIATTHSPYPVNELDPKEVRITWASEDGATRCAPLGKHPDFERWKDELWPGEFWSVVGEQWVGDGQGRESP